MEPIGGSPDIFYVEGIDRLSSSDADGFRRVTEDWGTNGRGYPFLQFDFLWFGFVQNIEKWVNNNGGHAEFPDNRHRTYLKIVSSGKVFTVESC